MSNETKQQLKINEPQQIALDIIKSAKKPRGGWEKALVLGTLIVSPLVLLFSLPSKNFRERIATQRKLVASLKNNQLEKSDIPAEGTIEYDAALKKQVQETRATLVDLAEALKSGLTHDSDLRQKMIKRIDDSLLQTYDNAIVERGGVASNLALGVRTVGSEVYHAGAAVVNTLGALPGNFLGAIWSGSKKSDTPPSYDDEGYKARSEVYKA